MSEFSEIAGFRDRILAIDPSLNGTGLCWGPKSTQLVVPPKDFAGVDRLRWLRDFFDTRFHNYGWDLVILEDYSYGSKAASAISLGEWGGILRLMLHELKLPVAFVPPSNLKKWLAGKGNANKETMISQATKRSGLDFTNSDEADAWALYAMACQHYGVPIVDMPADRAQALVKIKWPEIRDNRPK